MIRFAVKEARRGFVALFLLLLGTAPAFAHPHVWIDMTADLAFDNSKRLDALTIAWTFDEFYSAFAVQDFKKLPDGRYDPADLAKLADVNLTNLKDWNYFTEVTAGGNVIATYEPNGEVKPGTFDATDAPSAAEVERQARMAAGTW